VIRNPYTLSCWWCCWWRSESLRVERKKEAPHDLGGKEDYRKINYM